MTYLALAILCVIVLFFIGAVFLVGIIGVLEGASKSTLKAKERRLQWEFLQKRMDKIT